MFTKKVSVNGWQNLHTLMKSNGWGGGGRLSMLKIFNASASAAYVHLHTANTNTGLTGADGWPIGTAATQAGTTFEYAQGDPTQGGLDAYTTWLFTGGALDLVIIATGN